MQWLPIFNYADGYGLTYGIRVLVRRPRSARTACCRSHSRGAANGVPAWSWSDRSTISARGLASAFWVNRQVNPFFEVPDLRQQVRVEADHAVVALDAGRRRAPASRTSSSATTDDGAPRRRQAPTSRSTRVSIRCSRAMPIHTRIDWERPRLRNRQRRTLECGCTRLHRHRRVDGRCAARTTRAIGRAAATRPNSRCSAASDSLRGYRAGYRAGDNLAAVSAELRVPLNSPLRVSAVRRQGFHRCRHRVELRDAARRSALRSRDWRRRVYRRRRGDAGSGHRVAEDGKPRVHFGLGVSF